MTEKYVHIFNIMPVLERLEKIKSDMRFFLLLIALKDEKNGVNISTKLLSEKLGTCERTVIAWAKNLNDCDIFRCTSSKKGVAGVLNPFFVFYGQEQDFISATENWRNFEALIKKSDL